MRCIAVTGLAAVVSLSLSALPVKSQYPFVVTIEASVSGGARPIITGTTNLPDGTHLQIYLQRPYLPNARERLAVGLAACGNTCVPLWATVQVVVKNGQFRDGPFTDKGNALSPGTYVLEVMTAGTIREPPNVRAVIGERGENMTGLLVGARFGGGPWENPAAVQKQMKSEREAALVFGASIYYARYVEIGPSK